MTRNLTLRLSAESPEGDMPMLETQNRKPIGHLQCPIVELVQNLMSTSLIGIEVLCKISACMTQAFSSYCINRQISQPHLISQERLSGEPSHLCP